MSLLESNLLSDDEKMILLDCREAIKGLDADAEIIPYGSRARGKAGTDSDYDLLIVSGTPATLANEDRFRAAIYDIQLETATVITVSMVNRDEWGTPPSRAMPLHQNIEKDGITL